MDMPIHQVLSDAVVRIMRPLARVLLSHGMAYGTFAELAKRAFVEEGFLQVERDGKRATVSAVSALTGLTRKDVSRIRDSEAPVDVGASQRYNRAIRVISGWINDPDFTDASGQPAPLPLEGCDWSFAALVRRYSGDIPAAAMLSTLQASENVEVQGGNAVLVERAYIPRATPLEKINILGKDVGELVHTIGHNLEVLPEQRFFQRKVSNASIAAATATEFRALSTRKSQALLEEYNAWLTQHQSESDETAGEALRYVAVGIYYIELPEQEQ